MDEVVRDLEPMTTHIGQLDLVEAFLLQINDAATIQADQVVVLVNLGIEPGRGAEMSGLGDEAQPD
jgi:hypothetical protein